MNDFTLDMLESARERLRNRREKLNPRNLLEQARSEALAYRDGIIEGEAEQTEQNVPDWKLASLCDAVFQMLYDRGEWWGGETPDGEEEEIRYSAFGLACLRWFNREERGMTPQVDCTLEEIAAWLGEVAQVEREQSTYQMSLFGESTA
jgi:hypothetical protein